MSNGLGRSWNWVPLASVTEKIGSGATPAGGKDSYKEFGVALIRSLNVHDLDFRYENLARLDDVQAKQLSNVTVERGDVLLNITGASIARCAVVPNEVLPARVNQHVSILRPIKQALDSSFLAYFLVSGEAKNALLGIGSGAGSTRQALTKAQLEEFLVPAPPIDEQKGIVAALDQAFAALDRARANAEANLADAETVFDAWLTELFRERPSTWKTEKLNLLCDQITVGHVGPMADRYTTSGVPFLRSQNIRPFELSLVDVKSIDAQFHGELAKSALRPGDVAIVRTGYPGTAAAIPSSLPVSNCADLVIARPGERISPDFLVMFLNSSFGKTLVSEKSVGAAQKHFNVGAAKEAELPFPDRAEQDRLVLLAFERRDVARALAEAYRAKLSDIAELRQSLLQAAFSGQLS